MNHPVRSNILKVPGARIHYEVRGTGPAVLLIPGGPTDAGVFGDLARALAARCTVVAYDPRGNSRSTVDGEPEEQRLDVHADDAARLIDALGGGPTYVFGTSGGAQIGLELAVRHPERVRVLVAHEPPCVTLLPDPTEALAKARALYDTYRREGVDAAVERFMADNGLAADAEDDGAAGPAPSPEDARTFARIQDNWEFFFAHGLLPLSLYRPDVDALRTGEPRVVVGLGEGTVGQTIHRVGTALADALGVPPVPFPGDHGGYGLNAERFAATLRRAFGVGDPRPDPDRGASIGSTQLGT